MSIKTKVTIMVMSILLLSIGMITFISVKQSYNALLESDIDKLKGLGQAKDSEIDAYFSYLDGLLVATAAQVGTKMALKHFTEGFYELANEIDLPVNTIIEEMKKNYTTEYLNKVNYTAVGTSGPRPIDEYIPKDINGIIAQYIFIVNNPHEIGKKDELIYYPKYDSLYMRAHKTYHPAFDKLLEKFSLPL